MNADPCGSGSTALTPMQIEIVHVVICRLLRMDKCENEFEFMCVISMKVLGQVECKVGSGLDFL